MVNLIIRELFLSGAKEGFWKSFIYWAGIQKRPDLKPLSIKRDDDHWHFQVDEKKNLYWKGKKVSTRSYSFGELIAFIGLVVGISVGLTNILNYIYSEPAPSENSIKNPDEIK